MAVFSVATFLSALLLFIIQPLLAKTLLPWFGSSPSVWLSIVLFFQVTLLLGYFYAFVLTKLRSLSQQLMVHFILMGLSVLFVPILLTQPIFDVNVAPPFTILKLLSGCILLPIVLLSSSSPLLQYWYCHRYQTDFPYRYYAVSNFGSLLGLLGFPFLLEPILGLKQLLEYWSIAFVTFLVFLFGCLYVTYQKRQLILKAVDTSQPPLAKKSISIWLILTFLSSAFLLSSTQMMMQNILNLPLLWILPLALYLLTFIITFSYPRLYDRWIWLTIFGILGATVLALPTHHYMSLTQQLFVFSMLLFSGCMICHGELIYRKPDKAYLTHFYLYIALGGVLGGVFVNIIAPLAFTYLWDFYIPLIAIFFLGGALAYPHVGGEKAQKYLKWFWIGGSVALEIILIYHMQTISGETIFNQRNFYGKMEITEFVTNDKLQRTLRHGHILHGHQYLNYPDRLMPTTYYNPESGLAHAFRFKRETQQIKTGQGLRIGVIGLGTGTIAALCNKGDTLRFYEIDPDVVKIANRFFYYLQDTQAKYDVALGDGRLLLQHELEKDLRGNYDILAVDAFNGDAVPLHLVTIEALQLYLQHLNPNGILAFHVSSRYVDLYPSLQAAAHQLGIYAHLTHTSGNFEKYASSAEWVLLTREPNLGLYLYQKNALLFRQERAQDVWTDDFNYLLSAIRW